MEIDFNSRNFENPSIQSFFAGLQALALNEENPEPVEDLLEPDYEGMKKCDPLIQKFRDVFIYGNKKDPEVRDANNGRGGRGGRGRGGTTSRGCTAQSNQAS